MLPHVTHDLPNSGGIQSQILLPRSSSLNLVREAALSKNISAFDTNKSMRKTKPITTASWAERKKARYTYRVKNCFLPGGCARDGNYFQQYPLPFILIACSCIMLILSSLILLLVIQKEMTISIHPLASLPHSMQLFHAEGAVQPPTTNAEVGLSSQRRESPEKLLQSVWRQPELKGASP